MQCCALTCNTGLAGIGSCSPEQFNCTDPQGNIDSVAPRLWGIPQRPFTMLLSRVLESRLPQALTVAATDNNPCFDPTITVADVNLTKPPATPACTARVLYALRRTWTAVVKGTNIATKSQTISVADDQVPGTPTIRVQLSRWWLQSLDRVNVPVTWGLRNPLKKLTRKTYAWRVTPPRNTGAAVTKAGGWGQNG